METVEGGGQLQHLLLESVQPGVLPRSAVSRVTKYLGPQSTSAKGTRLGTLQRTEGHGRMELCSRSCTQDLWLLMGPSLWGPGGAPPALAFPLSAG